MTKWSTTENKFQIGVGGSLIGFAIGLFLFVMMLFFFLAPDWFMEAADRILTIWERVVCPFTGGSIANSVDNT